MEMLLDQEDLLYQSLKRKAEIISVTPTKYKVKSRSIYAF